MKLLFILRKFILMCAFLFGPLLTLDFQVCAAQNDIANFDVLMEREYQQHLNYEKAFLRSPDDQRTLWQTAYSALRMGWLSEDDRETQKKYYQQALKTARRLYNLYPDTYDSHMILGATLAKTIGYSKSFKKVSLAREIGEHANFLLSKKRDDPDVWYIFSWWNFNLSRVKKVDRALSYLLGGLPKNTSLAAAFEAIETAISLRPDYAAYHYDAGLFHERTGDKVRALAFFEQAKNIQPKTAEDFMFIRRANKKITSLQQ